MEHEMNKNLLHFRPFDGGHLDVVHISVLETRDEEGGIFEAWDKEVVVAIGLPLVLGQYSFCLVVDEEKRSAFIAGSTAACEVDRFVAEVQRGEDVLIASFASHIIDQVVGCLSDGSLFCIDHVIAVVLHHCLDLAFLIDLILSLLFFSIGAADQRKNLILVLPNIMDEDLYTVHVVQCHQGVSHMHCSLHPCIALQAKRSELNRLILLDIEPHYLGMIVGLDNSQLLAFFNFLVMDENRLEIRVIFVVVVGDPEAIFVGILTLDDAEVLGIVEGMDVNGVAVTVMELVVDLHGGSGLQVDEIDGGIGGVEHNEFLLAEHGEPTDHAGVIITVDELPLGVEVHDGLRLAGPHNRREDEAVIIGSGEGGDFGDDLVEVKIDAVLQQHLGLKYYNLNKNNIDSIYHFYILVNQLQYTLSINQLFFYFLRRMQSYWACISFRFQIYFEYLDQSRRLDYRYLQSYCQVYYLYRWIVTSSFGLIIASL